KLVNQRWDFHRRDVDGNGAIAFNHNRSSRLPGVSIRHLDLDTRAEALQDVQEGSASRVQTDVSDFHARARECGGGHQPERGRRCGGATACTATPWTASGAWPSTASMLAPIRSSGAMTRLIGRRESDESPTSLDENRWPARMPARSRIVVPELPASRAPGVE